MRLRSAICRCYLSLLPWYCACVSCVFCASRGCCRLIWTSIAFLEGPMLEFGLEGVTKLSGNHRASTPTILCCLEHLNNFGSHCFKTGGVTLTAYGSTPTGCGTSKVGAIDRTYHVKYRLPVVGNHTWPVLYALHRSLCTTLAGGRSMEVNRILTDESYIKVMAVNLDLTRECCMRPTFFCISARCH